MVHRRLAGVGGLERGGRTECSSMQGRCTHQGLAGEPHSFRPSVLGRLSLAKGRVLQDREREGTAVPPTMGTAERRTERVHGQRRQMLSRPHFPIGG